MKESLCEESVSLPTFHIPNHPIAMSATTTEPSANSLTTTCLRCSLWLVTWKLAFSSCVALMPTREPRGDESAMNLRGGTVLNEAYSPKCSEGRFSEVELPIYGVLGSCGFFLLPDNGDWARGVTDHGLRYASHQRPPYPSLPPAAHHYRPGTHALGQVDAKRQIT